MVMNKKQHSSESRTQQASNDVHSKPNKIGASTPYDFTAKNLTPYGGLLPIATMLEKIGFQQIVEKTLTVARITKVMPAYQFILAIVMGIYVGFTRLNQLRYIAQDPLISGILKVLNLPPQSTFWRFLNDLLETNLLKHCGYGQQAPIRRQILRGKIIWRGSPDFIRFRVNIIRGLFRAAFRAMLFLVHNHLGDLLESKNVLPNILLLQYL